MPYKREMANSRNDLSQLELSIGEDQVCVIINMSNYRECHHLADVTAEKIVVSFLPTACRLPFHVITN